MTNHTGVSNRDGTLNRQLGLTAVVLYGLGTTIGAGIYVLLGKIVGEAGGAAVFSFLLAALVAAPTAYSFSVLSRRFPQSGGEAVYAKAGFGSSLLASTVGLAVVAAGTISAATLVRGFAGYLRVLIDFPTVWAIIAISLILSAIAIWGIRQSIIVTGLCTLLEIGGIVVIIVAAGDHLTELPNRWKEIVPETSEAILSGIATGGILAFFAFIGFDDIVNLAEETRMPERNLPLAIIFTLAITCILYALLAVTAVLVLPHDKLATSEAPLADLFAITTGMGPLFIAVIGMIAVMNGALVQIVKGARVLYGLGATGALPAIFGSVHKRFGTPIVSTVVVASVLIVLALLIPIEKLAEATALITLVVFAVVNAALIRLNTNAKSRISTSAFGTVVPILGLALSLGLAVFQLMPLS